MTRAERFAREVRERREAAGLTQNQLAREARVSAGTVRNYESGREPFNPDRVKVVRVADAVGWSRRDALQLAGYVDTELSRRELSSLAEPDPRAELDGLLSRATSEQTAAVVTAARAIVDPHRVGAGRLRVGYAGSQVIMDEGPAVSEEELGERECRKPREQETSNGD
jgi:transcriptional regulator with XRE-family HTH domain